MEYINERKKGGVSWELKINGESIIYILALFLFSTS